MEYIDLDLPSGTLWANENYTDGEVQYFTYDEATDLPVDLPTIDQFKELISECTWTWNNQRKGYAVTGKNNNQIFFPVTGLRTHTGIYNTENYGYYCSSSLKTEYSEFVSYLYLRKNFVTANYFANRVNGLAIRTVQ